MQYHNLKRKTENKKSRQFGRGGKRGKTAGRGTKGQKARAGHKIRPEIRDAIKKLPKLRGYAFNTIGAKPITLRLEAIANKFESGTEVTLKSLIEAKAVSLRSGKNPEVKIVGNSPIDKKLTVVGIKVSKGATASITKAGGEVK